MRVPRPLPRLAALALLVVPPACAEGSPSTLQPHGPAAQRVTDLWWIMLAASSAVVVVVGVLVLVGALRRRSGEIDPDAAPSWANRLVIGGGVVVPVIVLSGLWGLTLRDMAALSTACEGSRTTVEVTGEQFWWRVSYPDAGVETANDIQIPAGEPVEIRVQSRDVIHSLWVPELGAKMDMIPGRTNVLCVQADESRVFRGQCAEFCGLQHANMAFYVIAQPRDSFDRWLEAEAEDARAPSIAEEARGREVFLEAPCAACHTIRGVSEEGTLGPDLTHFASRRSIGAGVMDNTLENLLAWIPNSQAIKPGNRMPPVPLSSDDLDALARYLNSLE